MSISSKTIYLKLNMENRIKELEERVKELEQKLEKEKNYNKFIENKYQQHLDSVVSGVKSRIQNNIKLEMDNLEELAKKDQATPEMLEGIIHNIRVLIKL